MTNLVFGTWEFELKNCNEMYMHKIVEYAIESGIKWFDTALVYGRGSHERLLADFPAAKIITKIPAKKKPQNGNSSFLSEYYTKEYIEECFALSVSHLKRIPEVVLLHNWSDDWNDCEELYDWVMDLKGQAGIIDIGISLPNNYVGRPISFPFDYIMAPLNQGSKWIRNNLNKLPQNSKILIRSLFSKGSQVPDSIEKRHRAISSALFADGVVIGMTREQTIQENIAYFNAIAKNQILTY